MNQTLTSLPKVSIILPFYNAANTLVETLDSIQAQTFTDYELIAVDDGSCDNSAEIIRRYSQQDNRIQLFQPGRQGVVGAMNSGLKVARAPLVARMDADDKMHPERLLHQFDFLWSHPEVSLVGSRVRLFPENKIQNGFKEYIRWQNSCLSPRDIRDEIYIELPIAHPSVMFRRDVIVSLGAYREGEFPEDYELLLRLNQAGHKMAKLEPVLLEWRESENRLTRTHINYTRGAFDQVRAEYLSRDPRLSSGRPLAFWGAGRKTRKRANLLLDKGFQPCAWIDIDPNKIGNRLNGVPIVAPQWLKREDRPFVLSYVSNHGARELIAAELEMLGYQRGMDYLMVG